MHTSVKALSRRTNLFPCREPCPSTADPGKEPRIEYTFHSYYQDVRCSSENIIQAKTITYLFMLQLCHLLFLTLCVLSFIFSTKSV